MGYHAFERHVCRCGHQGQEEYVDECSAHLPWRCPACGSWDWRNRHERNVDDPDNPSESTVDRSRAPAFVRWIDCDPDRIYVGSKAQMAMCAASGGVPERVADDYVGPIGEEWTEIVYVY